MTDSTGGSVESDIADRIIETKEFELFSDRLISEVRDTVEVIVNSKISLKSCPDTLQEGSPLTSSEFSWDSFVLQGNSSVSEPSERRRIAHDLGITNPVGVRLNAIKEFETMNAADIVGNEHWDFILKCLHMALDDPDPLVSSKVLQLHYDLFRISPSEATVEWYLKIVTHLLDVFSSQSLESFALSTSEDDPVFKRCLPKVSSCDFE